MAGLLLAVLTYFPLFSALTSAANPDLALAQKNNEVVVTASRRGCSFGGNPVARDIDFRSSCDIAKRFLAQNSVSYTNAVGRGPATVKIGDRLITAPDGRVVNHKFDAESAAAIAAFKKEVSAALKEAGYPARADPAKMNKPLMVLILVVLVIFVTMVYGPIAAALVELFPTRIRYTSMSLPYHIGNGWFGGMLPTISFAMVAANGNMYHGLWYPIVIAAGTFVIGMLFFRESKDVDIYASR